MKSVILSTSLLIETGTFDSREISLEAAREWVRKNNPENFCGHETVKLIGVEPDRTRKVCPGYDQALCLAPNTRLENREYTVEEISRIGVKFTLIRKLKLDFDFIYI